MPHFGRGPAGPEHPRCLWALRVVLDPPVLDQHLRLEQAVELLDGQELVAQMRVVHFDQLPQGTKE